MTDGTDLPDAVDLPDADELPDAVDLLVVGSGPVGATFARIVHDQLPGARILMVDAGPRLTEQAGQNTRNLPLQERKRAQARSQGPGGGRRRADPGGRLDGFVAARPGTFLINDRLIPVAEPGTGAEPGTIDDAAQSGMPAAAMSSDVGGMSAHWTCACPPPGGSERNPYLSDKEFDDAFARAGELLSVTTAGFRPTPTSTRVLERLGTLYNADADPRRPADRAVQPMPLACRPREAGLPFWSGADQVLGPLAAPGAGAPQFALRDETLCRRLILSDDGAALASGGERRVVAAELEHLPSGRRWTVAVRAVAVAADTFRTPQLLWASGVRPAALGRYLNDQPQIIASVVVEEAGTSADPLLRPQDPADPRDQLTGVLWVPFVDGSHPFHGQVMQLDTSPIALAGSSVDPGGPVIGMGWFSGKQVRADDRVEFSPERTDAYGMPAMTIHYELTDADRATIAAAGAALTEAAQAVGRFAAGGEPRLLPAGSSMHYQGTVRMGAQDDGTSVCDVSSRVWGTGNLFVGGNGVIPTSTACNPTATSVALAVIAAESIVGLLSNQ